MANVWSPLSPLLGEVEICIQWVFCRKFDFGQFLFKTFFDIIKSFGRNQTKFSKNFENQYFCSKNSYFRENPYTNPYVLKKSVFVWIHSYVWQRWASACRGMPYGMKIQSAKCLSHQRFATRRTMSKGFQNNISQLEKKIRRSLLISFHSFCNLKYSLQKFFFNVDAIKLAAYDEQL